MHYPKKLQAQTFLFYCNKLLFMIAFRIVLSSSWVPSSWFNSNTVMRFFLRTHSRAIFVKSVSFSSTGTFNSLSKKKEYMNPKRKAVKLTYKITMHKTVLIPKHFIFVTNENCEEATRSFRVKLLPTTDKSKNWTKVQT